MKDKMFTPDDFKCKKTSRNIDNESSLQHNKLLVPSCKCDLNLLKLENKMYPGSSSFDHTLLCDIEPRKNVYFNDSYKLLQSDKDYIEIGAEDNVLKRNIRFTGLPNAHGRLSSKSRNFASDITYKLLGGKFLNGKTSQTINSIGIKNDSYELLSFRPIVNSTNMNSQQDSSPLFLPLFNSIHDVSDSIMQDFCLHTNEEQKVQKFETPEDFMAVGGNCSQSKKDLLHLKAGTSRNKLENKRLSSSFLFHKPCVSSTSETLPSNIPIQRMSNSATMNNTVHSSSKEGLQLPLVQTNSAQDNLSVVNSRCQPLIATDDPPIAVFWDIENLAVPSRTTAFAVVNAIRDRYHNGRQEVGFTCVCNTFNMHNGVLKELNRARVTIVHVGSRMKNAADEYLLLFMRRYADAYGKNSVLVLISSDSDFIMELLDLRYRKGLYIILIHRLDTSQVLRDAAHETHIWEDFCSQLPSKTGDVYMYVWNLPFAVPGGQDTLVSEFNKRVGDLVKHMEFGCGWIKMRFATKELARLGFDQLNGIKVLGNIVNCSVDLPGGNQPPNWIKSARHRSKMINCPKEMKSDMEASGANCNASNESVVQNVELSASDASTSEPNVDLGLDLEGISLDRQTTRTVNGILSSPSLCPYSSPEKRQMITESCENGGPVELQVTNLDPSIDAREIKKILLSCFREHVMVLHIHVFAQSDGSWGANVKVTSAHEAQYAISQLHRKKIANKKILISQASQYQQPPEVKRSKVINLLQKVPECKVPLFKFRVMYEQRYYETIHVSELYQMRDLITVSDDNGRIVTLNPEYRTNPSPILSSSPLGDAVDNKYCKFHYGGPFLCIGWAEKDEPIVLPNVDMRVANICDAMAIVLRTHGGILPLASIVDCIEADYGTLNVCATGMPLEHLISCDLMTDITEGSGGIKFVQYAKEKRDTEDMRSVSPPLVGPLSLFSRELVDLLKTFPMCRLPFSKFIPAYHHHFGRQCRVADFGFTKLIDLFDSLRHIVQVMGEGKKKVLTLAHKAQIKRFSSDLLRVLKNQHSKMISLSAFSDAFEKIFNKSFNIIDYGVCDIEDMLNELSETTVLVTICDDEVFVAIPKREQTPEEIERTRQFALEAVELLKHSPQCKMQFNRFIPAYHHHFGRQCKVADYGFSKLVELFEAIPEIVEIIDEEDDEGEKSLQLSLNERLKVLCEQITSILHSLPKSSVTLDSLERIFMHNFGYALRPEYFDGESIREIIDALPNYVKFRNGSEDVIELVDRTCIHTTLQQSRSILWNLEDCSASTTEFSRLYAHKYMDAPDFTILRNDLSDYFKIAGSDTEGVISLVPVQIFARELISLLEDVGNKLLVSNFESTFLEKKGVQWRPGAYGFPTVLSLIQNLSEFVTIKGYGSKKFIVLKKTTQSIPSPISCKRSSRSSTPMVSPNEKRSPTHQLASPVKISRSVSQKVVGPDPYCNPLPVVIPQPQPRYPSPIVYPGSPVAGNGSLMWGQMWSSPYSMVQPMPPAHYMYPQMQTMPFNWTTTPIIPHTPPNHMTERCTGAPITMQTLEQCDIAQYQY